jgi:Flp pilus assembly protein TadD
MRRAIDVQPDRPEYRTGLAFLEATTGRPTQALALVREAYQQDPVSTMLVADAGEIAMYAGDARSALAYCKVAADGSDAPVAALQCAFEASLLLADSVAAAGFAREIAAASGGRLGSIPDSAGSAEAVITLRTLQAERAATGLAAGQSSPFFGASFLAAAGRREEALVALRQAIDLREPMAVTAAVHPRFSSLHHDPTFLALLAPLRATRLIATLD